MNRLIIKLLVIICLVLFSCTKKSNWDNRIEWQELEFSKLPGAKEYPDEGAIILHDEGNIETFGDYESGFTVYKKHRIVKILNARGHRYASVAIPYSPRSELGNIQARSISPSGRISIVKDSDIYDISLYPNFMLYSDQKAKLFTFPSIENGTVVEYQYRVEYKGHTYGNVWNFQDGVPVLFSRFSMSIPGEAFVNFKVTGLEIKPIITKAPEGFKASYIWEAKDLPPLEFEIAMPAYKNVGIRLNVASPNTESWKDVADWYYRLSKPQMQTSDEITRLVVQLTKGVIKPKEKLKIIYEWIRDNIRYVAVAIGIGSYQPHTAESILYNRYGDCKDMTTLLCTMAKEVELDVHQALISTWYNGTIDTALASVSQFNHVIAYCLIDSEEVVWMDATDKACSFDKLPWYDKGTQVLLIKDEGDSEIISTPKVSPTENRKQREWSVNLDSSGSAIVEGKEMLWGAPASELRYELMNKSKSQIRKWMESFIAGKCALAKLDTFSIFGVQPIKDPLIVNYKFVSSSFANKIDSRTMVFSPGNVSDMNLFEYFLSEKRVHPIRFRYSLFAKVKFILNLPENWKTKIKNYSNKINSEFGEASWNWFVSGKQLHIQNDYLINGKEIISEQYLKFKDYLKSIEKQELKEVVVVK